MFVSERRAGSPYQRAPQIRFVGLVDFHADDVAGFQLRRVLAVDEERAVDLGGVPLGAGHGALDVESHMAGNGVIFGDGVESDYLPVSTGATATIAPAAQ